MKHIYTLLFLLLPFWALSQTYYVEIDSAKVLKLQVGKKYTFKTDGSIWTNELIEIKTDTLVFSDYTLNFKQIELLKNPKRSSFKDVLAYPVTVGSCVAVSTIPISYVIGYFQADTYKMFNTVGLFIVETALFTMSRNYLKNNDKWIKLGELESFKFTESN